MCTAALRPPPPPLAPQYGVNLQPLLASLGASSIVAGLAAQSLLRNVAAGVTLVSSRAAGGQQAVRLGRPRLL